MSDRHSNTPLAIAYYVAECLCDVAAIGILLYYDHPWWAIAYCVLGSYSASLKAQQYSGVAVPEEATQ